MTSLASADRILISRPNLHMIQAWQAVIFLRGSVRNLLRPFFGDSRGLLSTMAKHPLLQRSSSALLLVTSGFEPPEIERNIGPKHDNEVHTFLCRKEVGTGSLSQYTEHFATSHPSQMRGVSRIPVSEHAIPSESPPFVSENNFC
jgi:hypothetical protein